MAWERPIGYEDELNAWENEEFAWDGDTATVATTVPLPAETWTGWLVLGFSPFIADRVHLRMNCPDAPYSFEVYAWDGSEWQQWIRVLNTQGPYDITAHLLAHAYDQVRIRWQHHGAGWSHGELNDVRIDRICGGPLVAICAFFGQGAEWLSDTADDIEDIMFVGDALAAPFRTLADTFSTAQSECCSASSTLQELLDILEGGITWDEISAMILSHWPALVPLIDDPAAYIIETVSDLIPDLPAWLDDPVAYITEIVEGLLPELPDWLTDPDTWLRNAIERLFPGLSEFLADPDAWLRERVLDIIREFTEDIAAFLDNAWGWLLDQYEAVFETIHARLYYLAEHTLRFFWEGEW